MVVSRRQADGYLQMALATASTVVAATADRMASAERVEELRLFVSAGQQVVTAERLDAPTLGAFAEEAVALVGGEAGSILRPRGKFLEVMARTEGWRGALGAMVSQEGTASGRACKTGRAVVSPSGGAGSATLALPLSLSGAVLGVLEVRLPAALLPLPPERLSRLDRFGRFISIALARDDERLQVERAMAGYAQLNELAAALGGQTDIDGIARLLTSVIDKSFTFDVAGLVLSSWGRDHADAVVRGEITQAELDWVLGEVSGRDVAEDAFGSLRTITHQGAITEGDEVRQDWSLSAIELEYGNLEVGYLFVARADGHHYSAQDHALLTGIAAHAGAAFGRAALFSRIREDYAKTIAALSATLDVGERMPSGHSTRVMDYAMLIGEELGLPFEDIESLRFAGLLHDIGKTGVPEEILLKPSKLSPEERARVEAHAELGASIVDQVDFLKAVTPVVLHHHERWDGAGYPHQLAGEAIPLLARILTVADSYDAMTTQRPHTPKLTIGEARTQLELGAGTQFDPRVVAALLEALDRMALAGSTGLLSSVVWGSRPELLA
jgi:putative nucleotidyltransferase with HDIG domain